MTPFVGYRLEMLGLVWAVSGEMRFVNYTNLYSWFYDEDTPPVRWEMYLYDTIYRL